MPRTVVQKNTRIVPDRAQTNKFLTPPRSGIAKQIEDWLDNDHNHYLGFGGTGDAVLTLASCCQDEKAKVIFFANDINFSTEFFKLFKTPHFIYGNIMGQPLSVGIQSLVKSHINFKTSGHLADNCDYGDWLNEDKYLERVVTKVDWVEKFGKELNPFDNNGVVVIAPHGSSRDHYRQRFLTPDEHSKLVGKFISQNYTVYSIGSESNLSYYNLFNSPKSFWVSSNFVTSCDGYKSKCDLLRLLRIVNSADVVYSMDTWMKTYTLLNNIDTNVVETRFNGCYKEFGIDITDWIFLNKKFWPSLKMVRIENLI